MTDLFYSELSAICRYRLSAVAEGENASILQHFNSDDLNNDIFRLDVCLKKEKKINISVTLKKSVAIELFTVRFKIPKKGTVSSIDRFYNLSGVSKQVWNNSFTPLFVSFSNNGNNFLLYNSNRFFSHKVINHPDFFELVIFIDAAAEHPGWDFTKSKLSTSSPVLPAGTVYNLEFAVLRSTVQANNSFPVLARYPYGANAAFIVTDHCDFDDHEKLDVFLHGDDNNTKSGWLHNGLKITKGVFTRRSTGPRAKQNDTLETTPYKVLIDQLYADGSEIAPHALNQSGQITATEFTEALNSIQDSFHPKTWIDHGLYLKYCYYMGGKENPDYQLIDALKERHYSSLWSYQDVPVDPNMSLNHFSDCAPTFKPARKVLKKALSGNLLVAGHEFKSMVQRKDEAVNRLEPFLSFMSTGRSAIMSIKSSKNRRKALNKLKADFFRLFKSSSQRYLPYSQQELLHFSPLLYCETGKPLHQLQQNDMLLFATQEITQLNGVYTDAALDKLIKEKGIHVGHTYILNDLPYIEGIFEKKTKYRLSSYWVRFVNALSAKVKTGEIWNPTLSEFVDYVKQCCKMSLEYISERAMIIHNSSDADINGLTFMLSTPVKAWVLWNGKKALYKYDTTGNLLFWGNVPANSQCTIEWQ